MVRRYAGQGRELRQGMRRVARGLLICPICQWELGVERRIAHPGTELACATCGTIRLELLDKMGKAAQQRSALHRAAKPQALAQEFAHRLP